MSNPHEEVTMEPIASKFLFNPTKLHISVSPFTRCTSIIRTHLAGGSLSYSAIFDLVGLDPEKNRLKMQSHKESESGPKLCSMDGSAFRIRDIREWDFYLECRCYCLTYLRLGTNSNRRVLRTTRSFFCSKYI